MLTKPCDGQVTALLDGLPNTHVTFDAYPAHCKPQRDCEEFMMLLDVISDAATEHEVYFLLHAYIEAIRHDDEREALPRPLRRLPFHGLSDVEERVAVLTQERLGPRDCPVNRALVQEAHAILTAALTRLRWLDKRTAVVRSSAAPEIVTTP